MKQLVQSVSRGITSVVSVPGPQASRGRVLIQTGASLISAGTERMLVDFAEKNLLQKARSRPDLVRQTLDKARREGVLGTLEAVQNRLELPLPLGYSCAGLVLEAGAGVVEFHAGDRVACAGGGYGVHAELVSVSRNLVVKLPDHVSFESAAFATVGAIALQGIRLAEVRLGEVVAVIGLGLLGQLTVQMLKAAGCIVLGIDIQPQRAALALRCGADGAATSPEELQALIGTHSAGHGADAVLITADTRSNQPVELAGEIARDKGIVVAVGAVGMSIPRKVYYEKEVDFRISRSYGPGRYDADYEEKGHDYPYGYVRWTEQRNMQAFVQMLAAGKVDVQPLLTHRFTIDEAPKAYDLITGKTGEPSLGVVLTYPFEPDRRLKVVLDGPSLAAGARRNQPPVAAPDMPRVRLGVLGAGLFATATMLPAVKAIENLDLTGIASSGGLSARSAAGRFGFAYCASDSHEVLSDPHTDLVAILTRHNQHARQVIAALECGKHVFVEKPLCLDEQELAAIVEAYQAAVRGGNAADGDSAVQTVQRPVLMVGFNRRFAPFVVELKRALKQVHEPLMINYRVNAGFVPAEHWTQDPAQGGGRLLGEGCHFIDLLLYLAGSLPVRVNTRALPNSGRYSQDNLLISLEFANGSVGTVTYVANGNKSYGKESLEVFGGGMAARIDDYRTLTIHNGRQIVKRKSYLRQDKGHRAEWQALISHLTGKGPLPMSFEEIIHSTSATLAAHNSLQAGEPVTLTCEEA